MVSGCKPQGAAAPATLTAVADVRCVESLKDLHRQMTQMGLNAVVSEGHALSTDQVLVAILRHADSTALQQAWATAELAVSYRKTRPYNMVRFAVKTLELEEGNLLATLLLAHTLGNALVEVQGVRCGPAYFKRRASQLLEAAARSRDARRMLDAAQAVSVGRQARWEGCTIEGELRLLRAVLHMPKVLKPMRCEALVRMGMCAQDLGLPVPTCPQGRDLMTAKLPIQLYRAALQLGGYEYVAPAAQHRLVLCLKARHLQSARIDGVNVSCAALHRAIDDYLRPAAAQVLDLLAPYPDSGELGTGS